MAIRWTPIPKETVEGVLLGYVVTVASNQQRTNETTVLANVNTEIQQLPVYIQAYTSTEKGRPSFVMINWGKYNKNKQTK